MTDHDDTDHHVWREQSDGWRCFEIVEFTELDKVDGIEEKPGWYWQRGTDDATPKHFYSAAVEADGPFETRTAALADLQIWVNIQ